MCFLLTKTQILREKFQKRLCDEALELFEKILKISSIPE